MSVPASLCKQFFQDIETLWGTNPAVCNGPGSSGPPAPARAAAYLQRDRERPAEPGRPSLGPRSTLGLVLHSAQLGPLGTRACGLLPLRPGGSRTLPTACLCRHRHPWGCSGCDSPAGLMAQCHHRPPPCPVSPMPCPPSTLASGPLPCRPSPG